MHSCYSFIYQSLEKRDEREARQERAAAQEAADGAGPVVAPAIPLVAAPAAVLAAGTPIEILLGALSPALRRPS